MTLLNSLIHDVKYMFVERSRKAFPDDKIDLLND